MTNESTRYFLYVRKSSEQEDRQVLSIDSQKSELITLAKREKKILLKPGSNLILKDKKLSIDNTNALLPLKKVSPELKRIHKRLEPLKDKDRQRVLEDSYEKNPVLLRLYDEIRTFFQSRSD